MQRQRSAKPLRLAIDRQTWISFSASVHLSTLCLCAVPSHQPLRQFVLFVQSSPATRGLVLALTFWDIFYEVGVLPNLRITKDDVKARVHLCMYHGNSQRTYVVQRYLWYVLQVSHRYWVERRCLAHISGRVRSRIGT